MKNKGNEKRLKTALVSICILFTAMILLVAGVLSFGILRSCESYMTQETASLIAANSKQIEMNINAYLEKIEKNVALMYSDDLYYQYDATNEALDSYAKIKYEEAIENRIVDLGLMENYADFCIVYRNNHRVGWSSKTTENMFADDDMFAKMSSYITDEKSQAAWCFGVCDSYDRLYYVKRLNENAILVASFYSNELENVFEYPQELKGMTIRLVDGKQAIIYSSEKEEIGSLVKEQQQKYLTNGRSVSVIDASYIVNTNVCENNWTVMCEVSTDIILKEFYSLRGVVLYITGVTVALAVLICILFVRQLSRPVDGMFRRLSLKASVDELSGLLNKSSFSSISSEQMAEQSNGEFAMVMLDVDNFKQINDTQGHAYGDQFISRMGSLMRDCFAQENTLIGRMGGDEFAVLYIAPKGEEKENARRKIANRMEYFMSMFAIEFETEMTNLSVSVSIGIADSFEVDARFETLYKAADCALYKIKRSGKNQYGFYNKEDGDGASK